jgi:hypothetical protein
MLSKDEAKARIRAIISELEPIEPLQLRGILDDVVNQWQREKANAQALQSPESQQGSLFGALFSEIKGIGKQLKEASRGALRQVDQIKGPTDTNRNEEIDGRR